MTMILNQPLGRIGATESPRVRLLLINPRFPESFWSFKWAVDKILPNKRTVNPPTGLATLAALCPEGWDITIVDENIESIPMDPQADIVGVCGMGVQFARQRELLSFYRSKGHYVVAGGSFASLCPERYESLAHTVVAGEAEYVWQEFCKDFEAGSPSKLYHETGVVLLADSPAPRFDLLRLDDYQSVALQFSRGCPFRCEFCDIIVMFGRRPRTKSVEQVGRELDLLRAQKVRNAFFVDDNLIGDKPAAKKLLRFLGDYQRKHDYQFRFGTEASMNLAQDDELLTLFREAHFRWVFLGIESADEESLRETKKFQNTRQDILTSVRHIYSYGIDVLGGFIVGFDNDTLQTFDKQYELVMNSGIQSAMIGLLTAVPRTPLYERLEKEGRLILGANDTDNTKLSTNVIPKQMSYDEMISGYASLHRRLVSDEGIAERIRNKIRYMGVPAQGAEYPLRVQLTVLLRLLVRGVLRGGVTRLFHFVRSIPFSNPRLIPLAVEDWIIGLAMRNYVDRHFRTEVGKVRDVIEGYRKSIEQAFWGHLQKGTLEVSLEEVKNAASTLSVRMKGLLDRDFFVRAAGHLEEVLERTTASVTLRIDELQETQVRHLRRLLKRLSRHGDRIHIAIREELRSMIEIDSSVFNLVLEG
ncbi:MAG: B12-binding domain-containing radical SAM protein [Gemmatimonadales bacterium]